MRVYEGINQAFNRLLEQDEDVFIIGEDIVDPYGGAFKVTRGLSRQYPDRVIATPISEESLAGLAGGLALCGRKPILEIMFCDFITLCFDQIVNFASKSVSMYGVHVPMNMLIRCPCGGNRSYGPTHSQYLMKHFIGIPNLYLYELAPFACLERLYDQMINTGYPGLLFENKILYAKKMFENNRIDDLMVFQYAEKELTHIHVYSEYFKKPDYLVITPGGFCGPCLNVIRKLFLEFELEGEMIIPLLLYPFQRDGFVEQIKNYASVFIVEESTSGGTWGAELKYFIENFYENQLFNTQIKLIHSKDSIIPTAAHLEKEIILQEEQILNIIQKEMEYAACKNA